ncbi:MAG: heme oxygenase [Sphingomonadaceae bacterium]|nr:MAG: heme oxygenase [Sphingomonadaceae bacterium]
MATRDAHDRLDALFSAYDLTRRDHYMRFLQAHAAAFIPIETALENARADKVIPDWRSHRRSDALIDDLEVLGLALPPLLPAPPFNSAAAVVGGAYVLEGSRLGAKLIRRSVGSSFPTAFLDASSGPGWKKFVTLIERAVSTAVEETQAQRAAIDTFALFERAAIGLRGYVSV